MEKKFNFGNKTIEVKLPSNLSSAGEERDFYNFHEGFCNCTHCEWVGGVESLQQAVRMQSVHLLCPDCGHVVAEVSYRFEAPVTSVTSTNNNRKFLV